MKQEILRQQWLEEEKMAHIKGWDFKHIQGRYQEEEALPWDFYHVIRKYLKETMYLLDMETGGGEFLLSLKHPYHKTAAIEGYLPNVIVCQERLTPLGINFKEADGAGPLPFDDELFDVVTNRHGDYQVHELRRVLKDKGLFITQQVGAQNDRELVELLLPEQKTLPFPQQYLENKVQQLEAEHFRILESGEAFQPIRFFDVGALVWFAHIIEWEFNGFSVDACLKQLYHAQHLLEQNGVIEGRIHRFYIVAQKMG